VVAVVLVIWWGLSIEARKAHADLSEIYSTQQSLEVEAVHDVLTGLPNRRAFDSSFDREWRRAQRMQVPISVIMIDVDFFKRYNDHYGHQAGDECLTKVARVFAGTVRRSSDLVARYGGEEFVAVLFHTPQDDGMALAETLREAVMRQDIEHVANPPGVVTISLGGATRIPSLEETPESLLKAADEALYRAKGEGRNRVAWALDTPKRELAAS